MFRYERDPRVGDWLRPRLGPFGAAVGSLVPRGFAAYARVLHPMYDADDVPVTWSAVAAATGRVVHPTAQSWRVARRPDLHAPQARPLGQRVAEPGEWSGGEPAEGSLGATELRTLADVLGRHTVGDLVVAFWEGTSWEGGMQLVAWIGEPPALGPAPRTWRPRFCTVRSSSSRTARTCCSVPGRATWRLWPTVARGRTSTRSGPGGAHRTCSGPTTALVPGDRGRPRLDGRRREPGAGRRPARGVGPGGRRGDRDRLARLARRHRQRALIRRRTSCAEAHGPRRRARGPGPRPGCLARPQ